MEASYLPQVVAIVPRSVVPFSPSLKVINWLVRSPEGDVRFRIKWDDSLSQRQRRFERTKPNCQHRWIELPGSKIGLNLLTHPARALISRRARLHHKEFFDVEPGHR